MDHQRIKTLLEKINTLYRHIEAAPGGASAVERDLMRSYIRHLYEGFLEIPEPVRKTPPLPNLAPDGPPGIEILRTEPPTQTGHPKTALFTPNREPVPAPARAEPTPKPEDRPAVSFPAAAGHRSSEPPVRPVVPPEEKMSPVPTPEIVAGNEPDAELLALFSVDAAKELSEKLGALPIQDIRKAMGLNERIFNTNELFSGDAALFDATLDALDRCRDFEEASRYLLEHVAARFDWSAPARKNKARNFIKLVQRRYNRT